MSSINMLFARLLRCGRAVILFTLLVVALIVVYIAWRFAAASVPLELPTQLCDATEGQLEKFKKFKSIYRQSGIPRLFGVNERILNDIFNESQDFFEAPEDYVIGLHALMQTVGGILFMHTLEFQKFKNSTVSASYAVDPYRIRYITISSFVNFSVWPKLRTDGITTHASIGVHMNDFGIPLSWPPRLTGVDSPGIDQNPPTDKCLPIVVTDEMLVWIEAYRSQRTR